MAKSTRYRAYAADGEVVDKGAVMAGVAKVTPEGADATLVVFYSGKPSAEVVAGSAEVRIPVGMASEVILSD